MSQKDKVLAHLKAHGNITPQQAIEYFAAYRLAPIINRLRDSGWRIRTEIIRGENRNGKYQYARYILSTKKKAEL